MSTADKSIYWIKAIHDELDKWVYAWPACLTHQRPAWAEEVIRLADIGAVLPDVRRLMVATLTDPETLTLATLTEARDAARAALPED